MMLLGSESNTSVTYQKFEGENLSLGVGEWGGEYQKRCSISSFVQTQLARQM